MRALIQRVRRASVTVETQGIAEIGHGLLVYLGIHRDDTEEDSEWMLRKILQARLFENGDGKLSRSVTDIGGQILVVSQITLYGDMNRGNRPDMGSNMKPEAARTVFEDFIRTLERTANLRIACGQFGAHMEITCTNDGPVTILIDSPGKNTPE